MYTTVFNALDYPACIIPVSKVDSALDAKKPPHGFLNTTDKSNYELCKLLSIMELMRRLNLSQMTRKLLRMLL